MLLVLVEDVYVQALKSNIPSLTGREDLNQLWALVKEYLSIRPALSDREMKLWVELKKMYEPDPEDQLWTLTQNYMHAPVEWKLYDLSGVHHFDREDLNQLWALVKEYLTIRPASNDKEMELWVELKRMYKPDPEDQLWTLTQNYMHAPVEWKLYDLSGVHHVTAKDKEIFMLVEKDYLLRRGLTLVMISYRLQVENHSQMAKDLIKKIYNIANTPRKQSD
nr:hypothetical protein [Tanacetum cinerariifolium]